MKLSLLSVLVIVLNILAIVGQCPNNNNLIISELESQTKQNVRAYLSNFNYYLYINKIDEIFASAT